LYVSVLFIFVWMGYRLVFACKFYVFNLLAVVVLARLSRGLALALDELSIDIRAVPVSLW